MSPRHTSQSRGKIMPSVQEVEDLLRTALEATEVDVTDISGEYVSASVTSRSPRLLPRTETVLFPTIRPTELTSFPLFATAAGRASRFPW